MWFERGMGVVYVKVNTYARADVRSLLFGER